MAIGYGGTIIRFKLIEVGNVLKAWFCLFKERLSIIEEKSLDIGVY